MSHLSCSSPLVRDLPIYLSVSGGEEYSSINKHLDTTPLCLLDRRFFYKDLLDTLKYESVFKSELSSYLNDFQYDTDYLNHLIKHYNTHQSGAPLDKRLTEYLVPYLGKFTEKIHANLLDAGAYVDGKLPYELYKFDDRALLFRRIRCAHLPTQS